MDDLTIGLFYGAIGMFFLVLVFLLAFSMPSVANANAEWICSSFGQEVQEVEHNGYLLVKVVCSEKPVESKGIVIGGDCNECE